jgi:hypothetical protein
MRNFRRAAGWTGLALAVLSAPVQGQELIRGYLGGGVSAPVGSLAASTKAGYDFLLGVSWRAPFQRTSLRFDAMFSEFTQHMGAPAYAQMASGNVNVQYMFGLGPLAPYVFGGPGYYFLRGDNAAALAVPLPTTESTPYQSSHFGVDAGAGVRYKLTYFSLFLEGRDNLVFASHSERQYVPVTAGISIPYPWGELGSGIPTEP